MAASQDNEKVDKDQEGTGEGEPLADSKWTPEQCDRITQWVNRSRAKPVRFKTVKRSRGRVQVDTSDPLWHVKLLEAFGTADLQLQKSLIDQVINSFPGIGPPTQRDPKEVLRAANMATALLAGIHPHDEIEGMLAMQMIAVHNAAMEAMRLALLPGRTQLLRDSDTNSSVKMMKIFMTLVETLRKYRGGGEQKMTVEHVHVNQGGQAIVGSVDVGTGKCKDKRG